MSEGPASILVDENGQLLATDPGTPADKAITVQGDPAGEPIPVTGSLTIDTTGLSTEAKQDSQITELQAIKAELVSGTLDVHVTDASIAVTVAALPLPAGGSTSALQTTGNASLASIDAKLTNPLPVSGSITVTGVATAANQATEIASLASIDAKLTNPLPVSVSGVATAALQGTGNTSLSNIDGKLPATLDTGNLRVAVENIPHVVVDSSALPSGASTSALQTTGNASLASIDGKLTNPLPVSGSVTATVTGVATAANQATEIASLASIDGKTPALVTGRVPVDPSGVTSPVSIAAVVHVDDNGTTISVDDGGGSITVDGSVSISGTPSVTVSSSALPSGAATAAKQPALGTAGTPSADVITVQGVSGGTALKTDGSAVTQPVSIAAVVHVDDNSSTISVDDGAGSLTVDGSVSITGTPTVNLGTISTAATEATLAAASAKLPATLGQKTMANSMAVAIASDQSAIPITDNSGSITIDGTVAVSNSFALDATLTGGTAKSIVRSAAKGSTTAADVTSTAASADRQLLDVQIRTSAGVAVDTFGGGTQFADGAARGTATGTLMMVDDGTLIQSATGDSSGRLNVNLGTWVGSTAPSVGQKSMANSLPVAIASDQNLPNFADRTTSGNLTAAAQAVTISIGGCSSVGIYTSGTWSLTAQIEATVDGSNWVSVAAQVFAPTTSIAPLAASSIGSATNVSGVFACAGYQSFRIRCSAYTSGTMTVALVASAAAASAPRVMQGAPSNIGNAWYQIVTDGVNTLPTMDAVARAGFQKITDGSNTAAVKAASTSAVATDPALVVELRNPSAATLSNVSGSASSVTLLSANTSRKVATIWNDSTAILYVKLGTTASTTSCTVKLIADAYYEVPAGYTGRIDGIWASATGSARLTEITV